MGNSLFDQLKKSGLIDKKKARESRKEKHKAVKQQKGKQPKPLSESKERAQQALAEKVARNRELNLKHKKTSEQKAIAAQIKQLIEVHSIEDSTGDIGYRFTDGTKVQRIFVTKEMQDQLALGQIAIVKQATGYSLVPSGVAEKIKIRDPAYVIVLNNNPAESGIADDPYADHKVPDDLMW